MPFSQNTLLLILISLEDRYDSKLNTNLQEIFTKFIIFIYFLDFTSERKPCDFDISWDLIVKIVFAICNTRRSVHVMSWGIRNTTSESTEVP